MNPLAPKLEQLAQLCGVQTAYEDVRKRKKRASADSVLAVLRLLGIEIDSEKDATRALKQHRQMLLQQALEPVTVAWVGDSCPVTLTLPTNAANGIVRYQIQLENQSPPIIGEVDLDRAALKKSPHGPYVSLLLRLPADLVVGYHRLRVETSAGVFESLVIAAPKTAYSSGDQTSREWGCFLPLYAMRSRRNWGAGDFTDLETLSHWTSELGGTVVGTLPLLAAFLAKPCDPSPYAPASRLAWNEFYIDVTRTPEFSTCPAARELAESPDFIKQVEELRQLEHVGYRRLMALKRRVLELLAQSFFDKPAHGRFDRFERFLREQPHIEEYARFRAAHERLQLPWQQWPQPQRDGELSDADCDRQAMLYHQYVQWIATEQLEQVAATSGEGLYLDLPLGVRPDGFDVWKWRDVYAIEARAGSPPDAVWTNGQDWGFPPLHPQAIRHQGYRHVRDYLEHHLRHSRLLRIDHVMQLHRLYWIPQGLRADQGVYVRYRAEEFYALLSLESHRCRTTLIGENLGTVPPEVDEAMQRHNVRPMYIVQYEVAEEQLVPDSASDGPSKAGIRAAESTTVALRKVPPSALAALNTHDMPMFAAWWRGLDIGLRAQLGLLSDEEADAERESLESRKQGLTAWLRGQSFLNGTSAAPDEGELLRSLLKFLSSSPAGAVIVNLEDLWLETAPQNIPGTGEEMLNWRRKAGRDFEDFSRQPDVLAALQQTDAIRRQTNPSSDPHERLVGKTP